MKAKWYFLICGLASLVLFLFVIWKMWNDGVTDHLKLSLITSLLLIISSVLNFLKKE